MRARTIKDCERDVKGIHTWEHLGTDHKGRYLFWCHKCGAVGTNTSGDTKHRGIASVTVFGRVQE